MSERVIIEADLTGQKPISMKTEELGVDCAEKTQQLVTALGGRTVSMTDEKQPEIHRKVIGG